MSEFYQYGKVQGTSKSSNSKRHLEVGLHHHDTDTEQQRRGREYLYYVAVRDGGDNLKGVYLKDRQQVKDLIDALRTLYDQGPDKIEALEYRKAVTV